ncbi:carbohydrate ABC transporter permease [Paenibacillus sp. FSL H7-0942]|jgi:putative aldouronate transport system permease protein|uniref:Aldouronate transport system permease protein n=2 Tax=Paenibacillus TaxID=44249 RepID=A0ABS4S3X1_PAEXY|nr:MULTISPECIES: carbohydrate ABC transporter permease [Paenibacillus]APO45858.1 sugar ABC transporter permease [Paenibacillus xylanexedens]ETT35993.1 binding-protein-dependent transport system inner membrane protein [Paenibacillus sp. FSL R5-192]ETT43938.1 binding-protein-dependent transport system inner membrane protein [Paenibacillus sp. FSL H7-689]KAA8745793.1 carbohydrate ABC transporter permease [Paenibacillus sp. UASWS1643]KLU54631.1 sugar ABC transporter permease [Paenibacillus sp. VT-
MGINKSRLEPIVFHTLNGILMIAIAIVTLYPFVNTLAVSFNAGNDTIRGGIYLWPRVWTDQNYRAVFAGGTIFSAFGISVARTVLGTVLSLFLTSMLAYTLSRKDYILRKPITITVVLTMYFSAGLIPTYFLMKDLHLLNNFLVYIIPGLISAFNMIVIRTYIQTLPEGLIESAKIDGAGDFRTFISIILPLCQPVLATVALFIAVGQWNSWFDTFLYASSKQNLSTLQYELMKLLSSSMNSNSSAAVANGADLGAARNMVTPVSIRAAITIVAALPILVVYPFLQKYFVHGLQLGGVKE